MTNEELSFRTKQALAAALKTALERKKLSKITVSELAEACQVNRKTFYYHFQDVYALFRWMLEQEAIDVVKNFDLVVDTEEALRFVMEYVDENKHLINGAFDSMGYEEIKRFFYNDLFSVLDGAISQGETELGVRLDPGFKKYLATFYTEASAGLLMEWIKSRDAYDKETVLENLLSIFKISMMAIIPKRVVPKSEAAYNKRFCANQDSFAGSCTVILLAAAGIKKKGLPCGQQHSGEHRGLAGSV